MLRVIEFRCVFVRRNKTSTLLSDRNLFARFVPISRLPIWLSKRINTKLITNIVSKMAKRFACRCRLSLRIEFREFSIFRDCRIHCSISLRPNFIKYARIEVTKAKRNHFYCRLWQCQFAVSSIDDSNWFCPLPLLFSGNSKLAEWNAATQWNYRHRIEIKSNESAGVISADLFQIKIQDFSPCFFLILKRNKIDFRQSTGSIWSRFRPIKPNQSFDRFAHSKRSHKKREKHLIKS